MIFTCRTETGKRKRNEDSAFVPEPGSALSFVAVADGMGGHAGGAVASRIVIDTLRERLKDLPERDEDERLLEAVRSANDAVLRAAAEDPSLAGMGSTLVAAALYPDRFTAVNVGDSRLYHLSGRRLTQVTRDHSFVAMLLEAGHITEAEARVHPNRNMITRAVGTDRDVRPDLYHCAWKKGDLLLLCSDGLCGSLEPDTMRKILSDRKRTPDEKADALIRAALGAGSSDNITVVLAVCEGGDRG